MATQGIRLYDASGNVTYDSDTVTWNQVDFFLVSSDSTVSKEYLIISGREVITSQIFVNAPPSDRKAIAFTITRNNYTITVSGGNVDALILVLMR